MALFYPCESVSKVNFARYWRFEICSSFIVATPQQQQHLSAFTNYNSSSSDSSANCHCLTFILFLFDGLLSHLTSLCCRPHHGHTATNHHYCSIPGGNGGAQNTGGDHTRNALDFISAARTCALLSCGCATPQTCTPARKKRLKVKGITRIWRRGRLCQVYALYPARACTWMTDLSCASDKLSLAGE